MATTRRNAVRRGRAGAAAVEFALALPVVLSIVAGIADYGWYFQRKAAVLDATHGAVRHGVAAGRGESPMQRAETMAAEILRDAGFECRTDSDCDVDAALETVGGQTALLLQVSAVYDPIIGLVPTPDVLDSRFVMLLEEQDPDYYMY